MTSSAEIERVLAEDGWLRRIARRLVGDREAADDLAQDAWVAALSSGRSGAEARPWLLGVLHNLRRKRSRRAADEQARARELFEERLAPATDELVLELTLRRRVTEGLLALEEPYRTAVYLRCVQDAKLAEIARRTGVAVSTAHERVRRGLELLCARLDRDDGGDTRAWASLLLPLAEPRGLAATIFGGLVVGTAAKVAVSLAALAGGLVFVWSRAEDGAEPAVPAVEAAALPGAEPEVEPPVVLQPLADPAPVGAARAALPQAAPPAAAPADAVPAPVALLAGRVIDADRAPVVGVPVGFLVAAGAQEEERATSGAGGVFSLPARAPGDERLVCLAPDLATLVQGAENGAERVVVVAPRADFAGAVVDPSGVPIAGAEVAFRVRQSLFRDLGVPRPYGGTAERTVATDADGRFALDGAAGGPHLALQVTAPGYAEREVDLPRAGDRALVVVLEPLVEDVLIRGLVLDAGGRPVPEALVSAGIEIATTDPGGAFQLRWRVEGAGHHVRGEDGTFRPEADTSLLMATKAGHGAVRVAVADLDLASQVVLRLPAEPSSLSGTVVDGEGRPRSGVLVWETNGHLFGSLTVVSGSGRASIRQTLEEATRGGGPQGVLTDGEGRFVLGGLVDGAYDLAAFDPATLAQAGLASVEAGTGGVVLVLPDEPGTVRVAGRVVTASGTALAGVQVLPKRFGLAQPPVQAAISGGTRTDAEGRFEFPLLATRGTALELQHDLLFVRRVSLDGREDLEHLELVEPVLCELQVDLTSDPELADRFEVLGEDGAALEMVESYGVFYSFGTSIGLEGGRSTVVRVPETARTLLLRKGEAEVLRRPLRLDPAQRTDLRL